jgi:hypothetical protein
LRKGTPGDAGAVTTVLAPPGVLRFCAVGAGGGLGSGLHGAHLYRGVDMCAAVSRWKHTAPSRLDVVTTFGVFALGERLRIRLDSRH